MGNQTLGRNRLLDVYSDVQNHQVDWNQFKVDSRRGGGVFANVNINEWNQLTKNFNAVHSIITTTVARTLAGVVNDLLSNALPRTPVKTGELRESGTAVITAGRKKIVVGQGTKEGTVMANLSGLTKGALKGAKSINANVSFRRFSMDKGEVVDVALWAHEELLPHEERENKDSEGHIPGEAAYARTPNTGPKYLEIPFYEKFGTYSSVLTKGVFGSVINNIRQASVIKSTKKTVFEVDSVEIVDRRIAKSGYYGF